MDIHSISVDSDELNELEKLYLEVFPKEERLDFNLLVAKERAGKGNFLGLFNDDDLNGMMYYAEYKEIIYILFCY